MKYSLALLCAATLSFNVNTAWADAIPLPERKPVFQNVSLASPSLYKVPNPADVQNVRHTKPEAEEIEAITLNISQPGDLEMSCGALSSEAASMRDIIYVTEEIKSSSRMKSHGVTAAGAIGSFLIGTATGGIGLALGGFLLDQNIENGAEKADSLQDTAAQRRTLMMGIFNAKGCHGPIEHAMANPEEFDTLSSLTDISPASGSTNHKNYND